MFKRILAFGLWLAAVAFFGGVELLTSGWSGVLLAAAPFAIATGDAQTVKVWSKALMVATIQKTFYSRFSATGPSMPFQIMTDLSKGPGDEIRFDLLSQMSGFGVNGNTDMMVSPPSGAGSNEQQLLFRQETIRIEQKRLAHAWYRMSQQRTVHDLLKAAMSNLSDRWAVIIDRYAATHLVGLTAAGLNAADTEGQAAATDIGNHTDAVEAHDANHIYSTALASAFATSTHLNPARWKAETITDPAPIIPIRMGGNEHYVMFIRPEQANNLQQDADWVTAQSNAQVRGDGNPMFTGALGMWNGIVLHVWNYLPYGTAGSATVRYGVLCGRQALAVAFGNAFDTLDQEKYGKDFVFAFVPREITDYGNIKGMSAGCVFGMRRIMFNTGSARTFGCIRVDSTDAAV